MNEDTCIKKESHVKLQGLVKAKHRNGRIGIVQGDRDPSSGRFAVKLLNDTVSIALKPENLKVVFQSAPCGGCMKFFSLDALRKCTQCKLVQYCSKDCQKSHWKREHKFDCSMLATASASNNKNDDSAALPQNQGDRVFVIQRRGIAFLQEGNCSAAEQDFRTLLEVEKFHNITSYVNLASCLIQQGRVAEATQYAEQAVGLPVKDGEDRNHMKDAYVTLGTCHAFSGNSAAAQEVLRRGLEIYPKDEELKRLFDRMQTRTYKENSTL